MSCCKALPDFCLLNVNSGFSGVHDAATGAIVVMPGKKEKGWDVPFPDGVPRYGDHSMFLDIMSGELGHMLSKSRVFIDEVSYRLLF